LKSKVCGRKKRPDTLYLLSCVNGKDVSEKEEEKI
jgi:hypothetical protein